MRKISKTLALMGLFAPWGAYALGVGEIRLHSALNEALNADIPLVISDGSELSDIRVTLAPPDAFAKANLERSYQLTKLHFTPKKKTNGSYVIKVTSTEAIHEPFLDFMVEVQWPKGRVQRQFTVLLDPPDSQQETIAGLEESPESESYSPPTERSVPSYAPAETVYRRKSRPNREPRASEPMFSEDRQAAVPKDKEIVVNGTEYGPVGRNETLWGISRRAQHPSTSQRQMLVAIYKANPQAFYKSSINALKAGSTLTIPDQATVIRLADMAGIPRASSRSGNTHARLKTTVASDDVGQGTDAQGKLQLLAPSESKSLDEAATTGKKGKSGKPKEDLSLELAETAKQESENYRKRLSDLEQQLSSMQKLLTLKDEQIASMQNPPKSINKDGQAGLPVTVQPLPSTAPTIAAPTAVLPFAKSGSSQQPPSTLPPTQVAQTPPPQAVSSPPPTPVVTAKPTVPPPIPKPIETTRPKLPPPRVGDAPSVQTKPTGTKQPESEVGFFADILDNLYYLIGGATGLLILVLLWQFKRRRSALIDNAESILTLTDKDKPQQPKQTTPELVNAPTNNLDPTPAFRSSFLSEFTPSDFDALGGEMEEVDPISEADVYLAYGRYKQAEDLILGAIAQNPERDECRLKLLEIHYATEDAQAFEAYAQELALTHKDTKPEFWEKVVEMGRELCAGNPLFTSGKPAELEGVTMLQPLPETASAKLGQDDIYLFDQGDDNNESYTYSPPSTAETKKPDKMTGEDTHDAVAYDFFNSKENEGISLAKVEDDEVNISSIENFVSFGKESVATPDEEIEIPDESMEEMLAKLDALSDSKSLHPDAAEKGLKASVDDVSGSSQDEVEVELEQTYQLDDNDIQVLDEMDEMGSKLDLARAYFDLGDPGAASAILKHVARHGSSAQQEEANVLLGKLDKK